jgi:hypothetical protein
MRAHELTPMYDFLDADGATIGSYANDGPNYRGSTFGNGWVRRQITIPIPEGVAYVRPHMVFYSYDDETTLGQFWIASFGSPGVDASFQDPQLPPQYFGYADAEPGEQ